MSPLAGSVLSPLLPRGMTSSPLNSQTFKVASAFFSVFSVSASSVSIFELVASHRISGFEVAHILFLLPAPIFLQLQPARLSSRWVLMGVSQGSVRPTCGAFNQEAYLAALALWPFPGAWEDSAFHSCSLPICLHL